MTVSNVINGRGKVSAQTHARVKEAIRLTGYVPNIAARRLAGAAGTRLGLVYSDIRSPFLSEVLLTTLASATAIGAQLVVREGQLPNRDHAEQLVMELIDAGAEGLLLVPPYAELLAESDYFQRLGVPAVAIAGATPLAGMQTIRIDNRLAADQLTSHLIQRGHRQIAFITGLTFWLGNTFALGLVLTFAPDLAAAVTHVPRWINQGLGVATLAAIAAYMA